MMSAICSKFKAVDVFYFTNNFTAQDSITVNRQFETVEKNERTKVLLDFTKLDFIDSTAVGLLIKYLLEVRINKGKILLLNPMKQPLSILKSIGVAQLFDIEFSRRRAYQKLA